MRRIALLWGIVALGLVAAPPALAGNWGETWGSMIWGSVAEVPSLEGFGVWLLVIALFTTAAWRLRRRSLHASLMLVLLALVPMLMAPHYSTWNGFMNGEVADAEKVNENFIKAAEALDDFETRVGSLEANALPATTDASGVNLGSHLDVSGNLSSTGNEGGIITANRGAGTIVVDPTGVTSGYTATLSLDDEGIKLGHDSDAHDIQFQIQNSTKMTLSRFGDLNVDGDVTGTNLSSHFGNASAHHARYSEAEAVGAMGAKQDTNALNHDRYTDDEALQAAHRSYNKVAVVAVDVANGEPQGPGDYNHPVTALNDIDAWCGVAALSNPCLLRIMPGVYNIGNQTLDIPSHVDVEGSGQGITRVIATTFNSAVEVTSHTEIRFLSVEATHSSSSGIEIPTEGQNLKLTHVTSSGGLDGIQIQDSIFNDMSLSLGHVTATGSRYGISAFGINSSDDKLTLSNVTATGGDDGIHFEGPGTFTLNNVIATGGLGAGVFTSSISPVQPATIRMSNIVAVGEYYGVRNRYATAVMTNVTATSDNIGVYNDASAVSMMNVTATGGSYGVDNSSNSSTTIKSSSVEGGSYGIRNFSSVAKVAATMVEPNPSGSGFTCVGAYDASFAALDSSCL